MAARHEFVDHEGELHLRVRAGSLAELLAEAGRALSGISLRERDAGAPGAWREIEIRAPDRAALLVDWLNELVWAAEAHSAIPAEFDIQSATDEQVRARVRSVPVSQPPALVKAATLHQVRVEVDEKGYAADVILDI